MNRDEVFEEIKKYLSAIEKINSKIIDYTKKRDILKEKLKEIEMGLKQKVFFENASEYKNAHQRELALEVFLTTDNEYKKSLKEVKNFDYKLKDLYDKRDLYYMTVRSFIAYLRSLEGRND